MKKVILEIIPENGDVIEIDDQQFIPKIGDSIMIAQDSGTIIQDVVRREFRYMDNELKKIAIYTEKNNI